MKMKKVTSLILVLLMCLLLLPVNTFAATTPESSTYEDYADSLAPLGVFKGTDAGYELDRAPTRIEGLIMLIRLLGVEEEALAMGDSEIPFTDVPNWASGYVAYAYANDLANGISNTDFGSTNSIEAKAFVTFLLRSLGYSDAAGDFNYSDAVTFANGISLLSDTTYSTLTNSEFLRAHVAKTSYDTLKFPAKGESIKLINKLMEKNKVSSKVGDNFISLELCEPVSLNKNADSQNQDNPPEKKKVIRLQVK